jgi:hypothetical protein
LWLFGIFFSVLVCCTKKNLATLVRSHLSKWRPLVARRNGFQLSASFIIPSSDEKWKALCDQIGPNMLFGSFSFSPNYLLNYLYTTSLDTCLWFSPIFRKLKILGRILNKWRVGRVHLLQFLI